MKTLEYREQIIHHPPCYIQDNRQVMFVPNAHKIKHKWDEENVVAHIIANMKIAGRWFCAIMPNLYLEAGPQSGLMVTMSVPSKSIIPDMVYPGDIDILVIPYESNELILSKVIAVEIKILRAEKRRPNKSPNKYGFSQAASLFDYGFPYVAVGHLIVTDETLDNPDRNAVIALTGENGRIASCRPEAVDMFEKDIALRSFGRLKKSCENDQLGYFVMNYDGRRMFEPIGYSCSQNMNYNEKLFRQIGAFYKENYQIFLELPRYSSSDIELWTKRMEENPEMKPPWIFHRDLFGGERILRSDVLLVKAGGELRIGYRFCTENEEYILYDV